MLETVKFVMTNPVEYESVNQFDHSLMSSVTWLVIEIKRIDYHLVTIVSC